MRVTVFSNKTAMSVCLVSLMVLSPLSALAETKPQYLPPIAPKLDRSIFQPVQPVTAAPSMAQSDDDNSPAARPSQADQTNDRVKDLLRNAIQKHNQGDANGARQLFRQVLSIDPRNSDANFNLGAMAEDAGDLQAAQGYYKAASLASPGDNDIREAVASVNSKIQQKTQQQQTAMQLQKKNELRTVAQDAAAAYKAGQYDKAISLLERIDHEAPGDANVKYGLGQAYRGKGDMARARQNLQAAASLDPNNQLYRNTLADADRQGQQPQVARQPQGGSNPGGMQYDNMPPGARDYGSDNSMPPAIASSDNGAPEGQITPFDNGDSPANNPLYGHAYGGGPRGITIGSGGLGGLGLGALGGLGSMMMGGGARSFGGGQPYYNGNRGTRLVRGAVMGGLGGAAVGALTSMGRGSGGMKSGAMRGAVMGGLFGLLSGF
jgi:Flp pilus assembly protein TadD